MFGIEFVLGGAALINVYIDEIMNGQMKKYNQSLKNMPSPILLSQMTGRVQLRDLMTYAKKKGVKVAELSEEEKMSFVKK